MSWVAVNKNGGEYIFNLKPERGNVLDKWYVCNHEQNSSMATPLPKGSIKRLTSIDLTWDDEPLELKYRPNKQIYI